MMSGRVVAACVVLAGCGSSPASTADTTAFAQQVTAATAALNSYQAATATMSNPTDCSTAVNGYGTPMQGALDHMMSVSNAMDDHMRSMGQPSRADVGCGVQGMDDELRRHLQVACHEADIQHNREEAAHHIATMANALQHMQMRATEVSSGMGYGMMDGGWRMWDGGMMDPDDHPMGCPGSPYPDGGMPHWGNPGPMMDGGLPPWGNPGPMMDGGIPPWGYPGPMMDGGMGHMP